MTFRLRNSRYQPGFLVTVRFTLPLAVGLGLTTELAIAADPWSSPASWQAALPRSGEVVTIPSGSEILLDTDPPALGGLIVRGKLTFDRKDLRLTSRWILIDGGALEIGSPEAFHTNQALITLTGTDENENVTGGEQRSMGTKFIGVMNGGSLELHGARAQARNWTQLAGHALAGSTQLQAVEAVDWKPGDQLVIAPSGFDPAEAEEVTVTLVKDGVIHFAPPLQHDHWGELQFIGGHRIDERAEVACLTRNIVIQGDEASAQSDFGGHLMFGPGTTVHIQGVELNRMGQKGHAGRYPIHWHMAGDRPGDYARGNSIHHSFHRAIVAHGTSNVTVENNVSYDIWSHAFVPSEDGSETGNRFDHNLAILTRKLALADYAFPESAAGGSSQSESRPAAFWMRSPQQILLRNHVAGVIDGMGFFFDGGGPDKDWTGAFSNNTAHACSGPSGSPADRYSSLTKGYGLFMEHQSHPAEILFQDFTAYKNTLSGMWLEAPGQRAQHATLADNGTGAILFQSTLEDSVIIGQTENRIGNLPHVGTSLTGGVHLVADGALKAPQLRNLDFFDQRDAGIVVLGTRLHPLSTLENLRFSNTVPCRIDHPTQLIGGFTDADGSVRGDGIPVYIHGNDSLVMSPKTAFDDAIDAWVTPLDHLQFLSLTDTDPSAGDIGYTVLTGEAEVGVLADTGLRDRAPTRSGYLKKNSTYKVSRFDPLPTGVQISMECPAVGFVQIEIPSPSAAYLYEETISGFDLRVPDFARLVPQASDLADLLNSLQTLYYVDPAAQTLHLRLQNNRAVYLFSQPAGGLDLSDPEALWRSQQFGYHTVQDESAEPLWGSHADPDGDGVENRVEFFLARNPLRPDPPLVLDPALRRLTFLRNPAASNLAFLVSYSNDLAIWHSDAEIREQLLPDGLVQVNVTASVLPSHQSLFMALKVHQIP